VEEKVEESDGGRDLVVVGSIAQEWL